MRVRVVVIVLVVVHEITVTMDVRVAVRPTGLSNSPGEVHQPEGKQCPGCEVPTCALDYNDGRQARADEKADGANQDRTQHVTEAAPGRESESPRQ